MLYKLYFFVAVPTALTGIVYLFPASLEWPHIWMLVLTQIVVLETVALIQACAILSPANGLVLFAWSVLVSWAAEALSIAHGTVFGGTYRYAAFMGPQLPGGVPLIIPLCWFGLAYLALLYTRGDTHRRLGRAGSWTSGLAHAALASYCLCVMDLVLDPISTGVGAFVWDSPGAYYTTPLGNYAGWFLVGMTVFAGYALFEWFHPSRPVVLDSRTHERLMGLLGLVLLSLPALLAFVLGRAPSVLFFVLGFAPILVRWLRESYPRSGGKAAELVGDAT